MTADGYSPISPTAWRATGKRTLPEALARGLLPSAEPERVPVPVGECPF